MNSSTVDLPLQQTERRVFTVNIDTTGAREYGATINTSSSAFTQLPTYDLTYRIPTALQSRTGFFSVKCTAFTLGQIYDKGGEHFPDDFFYFAGSQLSVNLANISSPYNMNISGEYKLDNSIYYTTEIGTSRVAKYFSSQNCTKVGSLSVINSNSAYSALIQLSSPFIPNYACILQPDLKCIIPDRGLNSNIRILLLDLSNFSNATINSSTFIPQMVSLQDDYQVPFALPYNLTLEFTEC